MSAFPSTHWSFVTSFHEADSQQRLALTETFLTLYLPPIRSFLNREFDWISSHDREDIVQGFVLDQSVQRSLVDFVDRKRGKMRTFLCQCVCYYALNWTRHDRRRSMLHVDNMDALASHEVSDLTSATFDIRWARYVLTETILRMKDECHELGKQLVWDTFDLRLLRPVLTDLPPVPYAQLAEQLDSDEKKLQNLLITGKRLLGRKLRDVIEQYVVGDEAIQSEIDDLIAIVAQHSPLLDIEGGPSDD